MTTPKVSVIIPVFNADKYLKQCIYSIIHQTLKEIEIIIINDGSNDESKSIIDDFLTLDHRIIFIDTHNKGVSSARNSGIEIAKGEFIGFVDADDWIDPDMFFNLYSNAKEFKADMVICNSNIFVNNVLVNNRLHLLDIFIDNSKIKNLEFINLMRFKYDYSNWNKLYSLSMIKLNHLHFNVQMHIFEDLLFNCCCFLFSKNISIYSKSLYNYRIHSDSVMNSDKLKIVKQYNLLYKEFSIYTKHLDFSSVNLNFNLEMRRGFYYSILPNLVTHICQLYSSFYQRAKLLISILYTVDPALFNYSSKELIGFRGIKMKILQSNCFIIFSIIVIFKAHFFRFKIIPNIV
jgi:glycosyltransferase involved in cell wall biosynthesis